MQLRPARRSARGAVSIRPSGRPRRKQFSSRCLSFKAHSRDTRLGNNLCYATAETRPGRKNQEPFCKAQTDENGDSELKITPSPVTFPRVGHTRCELRLSAQV